MKHKVMRERPFEYMRRKLEGTAFPEETVRNWYIARAYVLDLLKDIAIGPGSGEHLEVTVEGDSPLMLAIVRQLALSAHFVNFEEYDRFNRLSCRNRSVIRLLSDKEPDAIVAELEKEENLCNLLRYCRHIVYGGVRNKDAYLDLEFVIVKALPSEGTGGIRVREQDVLQFVQSRDPEEIFSIDTRKAVLTDRVYGLGVVINNLPAEDIHSARRYMLALDTFRYKVLERKITPLVSDARWSKSLQTVKNGLSCIFCSDCFESRARGIRRYAAESGISEREAWESNNEALTVSEHNRWVTDKLIMGFRPMSDEERLERESLFDCGRAAYAKMLKNNAMDPSHLDICSCLDLRRSDPDNLKYDSFLLLAIPLILEKVR